MGLLISPNFITHIRNEMYQLVMLYARLSYFPKVAGDLSDIFLACTFHIPLSSAYINILTSLSYTTSRRFETEFKL